VFAPLRWCHPPPLELTYVRTHSSAASREVSGHPARTYREIVDLLSFSSAASSICITAHVRQLQLQLHGCLDFGA
jgi:hypothetical protein